ncbi:MAG: sensor histidine kinase [Brevundimonas sp.]|uniref:sensor histidine kinase n=1 Tax=Brevundimonas sp. TaxID=1871086 RepID=UPI004034B831
MIRGRRPRIPTTLLARLVGLLAVTLLAAQIVGGVLFFSLTPPPGPMVVHVSEIAEALATARSSSDARREAFQPGLARLRVADMEPLLADRLGVAAEDVRLWQEGPMIVPVALRDRTRIDPVLVGGYRAAVRVDGKWVGAREQMHDPSQMLGRMGLWLVVSLVCIAPVAAFLGARLTYPITAFAEAADRLGHDPYAPPMKQAGPAEVVLAIKAFNDMQGRLRAYIDDRVRMVGAIAHDLRTPLTRLRLQLEGLSPAARARAEAEIERMNRMVEGALVFVKDAATPPERIPLHLLSLVAAVVDDMSLAGADVVVEGAADPVVLADEGALRRVVGNLVDNGLTYGGCVVCRVEVESGWAILKVDDPGPGLEEADLERVFEPYVRLGQDASGIGLGLSIVRSIVRAHGGGVSLQNLAPQGLRALVRLPLAGGGLGD